MYETKKYLSTAEIHITYLAKSKRSQLNVKILHFMNKIVHMFFYHDLKMTGEYFICKMSLPQK